MLLFYTVLVLYRAVSVDQQPPMQPNPSSRCNTLIHRAPQMPTAEHRAAGGCLAAGQPP